MLRVGTAALPGLEQAEVVVGTPHASHASHASQGGQRFETYHHPASRFEPYEELSPKRTIYSARNSIIEGNPVPSYRQHQRQQSAPSFPARRLNAPSSPSPSQGHNNSNNNNNNNTTPAQNMALTGDRRNSPGRFGGRRSGASTPLAEHDTASLSHQTRTPVDTTPKNATQSRLGFFASSVTAFTSRMTSPTLPPAAKTDDELCDLDIEAALFPASLSSPMDSNGEAFSPAAYKNLQTNATGLLHRMQDAYRQRTVALRELQAEREAQQEEMEEMELRARHFRTQLETMAAKAAEQETAMKKLVEELRAEKQARLRDEQQRAKMMLRAASDEDLGVDEDELQRRRWRASNSTVKSELSIDTDAESAAESESIFSRSRSPTAMTIATENESCLEVPVTLHTPGSAGFQRGGGGASTLSLPKPKSAQQLTAFQRLVKGISAGGESGGADGCRNCKGRDASVAWDTVSLLRDENLALKQRVAHLDVVVEATLDVVNGIGR
ncbi:hypothetical protein F4859DRAFT_432275 [Xylaria cf. heliscus]|nr:hypothetical protein F4859DRAFT_432275 [Xylaria cf. heliscus]